MPADKIKQLEELVSSVLQNLDNFYSENSRLKQQIQVLEKEKAASSKENDRAKDSLDKMEQLEISLRKLKKDGSAARIKVKNVLQKIEKMDFV
jgi:DNA repair exonuclease SbcCD ATPase subunit